MFLCFMGPAALPDLNKYNAIKNHYKCTASEVNHFADIMLLIFLRY